MRNSFLPLILRDRALEHGLGYVCDLIGSLDGKPAGLRADADRTK